MLPGLVTGRGGAESGIDARFGDTRDGIRDWTRGGNGAKGEE
jgi:hypothetical protein